MSDEPGGVESSLGMSVKDMRAVNNLDSPTLCTLIVGENKIEFA